MKKTRLIVSLVALGLSACSTLDVKKSQRTTSAEYNGVWTGELKKPEPLQMANRTRTDNAAIIFRCDSLDADVTAKVDNGVISGTIGLLTPVEFSSNIGSTGRIYFEQPRDRVFFAASDNYYYRIPPEDVNKGTVRTNDMGAREYHVLEGNLSSSGVTSELLYTSALGMHGGCKYAISLTRES